MPEVRWRLTSSFPKQLDTIYGTAQTFARYLAEATDNRFQVQTFSAGELVPGLQALDAVQNGSVECAHTPLYFYVGKEPALAFATGVPFGLNARHQHAWWHFAEGDKLINGVLARFGAHALVCGQSGCQMGGFFRKELREVADLNGLKFRIGGLAGQVLAKLGVVPQQIPAGDTYPALERGTLDAAEFVGPYDDEKLGFFKVAPFYYYPGWWEGCGQGHNIINISKWNELPKTYQAAIQAASHEQFVWTLAKYDALNASALKRLLGQGVQLRAFPQEVLEACYKAANEIYAGLSNTNPHFKKMYESLTAFRGDSLLWMQVAELGFDSFMMRMRTRA
jgi:TRAP-type mannitol/chloroaromatic compound transport system substrate-binding protein